MTQSFCVFHVAIFSINFPEMEVIGCLSSSEAWVCGKGTELCFLNIHRLAESIIYQRLMNHHRLPVHHCNPVSLTPQ